MNRADMRAANRHRRKIRVGPPTSKWTDVPEAEWPADPRPRWLVRVAFNERFIVQVVAKPALNGVLLLMVARLDARDGITWDELQLVKEALYGTDREAVELYPAAEDLVNVANMRHLWLLPAGSKMGFGLDKARMERGE